MLDQIWFKIHCGLKTFGIKAFLLFKKEAFSPEDALIITGTGRSGTTWLADIISSPLGFTAILEPLHLSNKYVREVGFSWTPYLPPDTKREDVVTMFRKILSGKTADGFKTIDTHILKIFGSKFFVLKFIRLNRLLPWLLNNFRLKYKPILIIRHPCGVIYSQMMHPYFPPPPKINEDDKHLILEFFPHLTHYFDESREHILRAISWALDNFIPLHFLNPDEFILVSYEKLVIDPVEEIAKIYKTWGLKPHKDVFSKIKCKSKEARTWAEFEKSGRKKLGVWKKYLTPIQIYEILDTVHRFGFIEFSDNTLPDFNLLRRKH